MAFHFLDRANNEYNRQVTGIVPSALAQLMKYPWPGNVRELRNVIDRAVLICISNEIMVEDLPERLRGRPTSPLRGDQQRRAPAVLASVREDAMDTLVPMRRRDDGSANFKYYIRACEIAMIRAALSKTENNQTKAAENLKMSRHSLVYKIREYHIYDTLPEAEDALILAQLSRPGDLDIAFKARIAAIEARMLKRALKEAMGDAVAAARKLGLHNRTFASKVKRYGL
jgi:DNA-binding NtrC family response regulator